MNNCKKIWVDGYPMSVTANLYAALYDLREPERYLRLWADAVSINQTDIDEKGCQVSMMWRIYAAANHTIIHLGSADDADHVALERFALGGRRVKSPNS